MGVLLGPFDPIKLIFNILNTLMSKGILSESETRSILRESMDPQMPDDQKESILNSLIQRRNG